MQITIFSVAMTVLWSSLLIVIVSFLRSDYRHMGLYSIPGILMLYMFCVIRMFVPIEFPWVKMVFWEGPYNALVKMLYTRVDAGIFGMVLVEHIILMIWAVGAILFLVNLTVRYLWVNSRIQRLAYSEDEFLKQSLLEIEKKQGGKTKAQIYRCYSIDVPLCVGIWSKKILIPDADYGEVPLQNIILHEYTHIRNHDQINRLLVNLLCAFYWWNPFIYILRKDLEFYLECHCDQVATRGMDNEELANYVSAIVAVIEARINGRAEAGAGRYVGKRGFGRDEIRKRCSLIKEGFYENRHSARKLLFPILMMVILLLSYSFSFHPKIMPTTGDMRVDDADCAVEAGDSYILHKPDGTYELVYGDGNSMIISFEAAEKMRNDGFIVKEEVD